jgi:aspartate carbamoyltransferase catalytic subunit
MSSLYKKHLLSIDDLGIAEIDTILTRAKDIQEYPKNYRLDNILLASCFFEPSTRTRLSFETACIRLGGKVIGFGEKNTTSIQKGESLADTVRIIGDMADIIILRHPSAGSSLWASKNTSTPIINAGDGANQHPTQTLLDLFTIKQTHHTLENLSIAIVGDLYYGRTVHSLVSALAHYQPRLYFVSPPSLSIPETITQKLKQKGVKFSYHTDLWSILPKCSIVYMTRLQKERMQQTQQVPYTLTKKMLSVLQPHCKILHPMPRNDEIDPSIDSSTHAWYFVQSKNGILVRQAILSLILQKEYTCLAVPC